VKFIDTDQGHVAVDQIAKYVVLWEGGQKQTTTLLYNDKDEHLGSTKSHLTEADFHDPPCVPATTGQTIFWGYPVYHDDQKIPDDIDFIELPVLAWRIINFVGNTYMAQPVTIEAIEEDFTGSWILYPVPGGYAMPEEGIRETLAIWKEELLARAKQHAK